jgi:hypothetical protein
MKRYAQLLGSAVLVWFAIWFGANNVLAADSASAPPSPLLQNYLGLPLSFEANRGQAPSPYGFVAHGPGYALGVAPSEVALTLHSPGSKPSDSKSFLDRQFAKWLPAEGGRTSEVHLRLTGGNPEAAITGLDELPGRSNYFIGNDPSQWRIQVPQYRRVRMAGVYPGTDLVFYGNPRQLEYDFQVQPGADPSQIRFAISGAQAVSLDAAGNVVLETTAGELRLKSPVAYQKIAGNRQAVESRFRMLASGEIGFKLGPYDATQPLVIDPVLVYSVLVDGNQGSEVLGITVDGNGNAYITGNTCSTDFPTTAGPLQSGHTGFSFFCEDVFVMKLDPTASSLIFSDFIGGSGAESGTRLTLDNSHNIYVVGLTASSNFPTSATAVKRQLGTQQPSCPLVAGIGSPCFDAFALKLSADGSTLLYSTLLGGSYTDIATDVKVNSNLEAYVVGVTMSSNFVPQPNGLQTTFGGGLCQQSLRPCADIFLVKLNADGSAAPYVTYFGGNGEESAAAMILDGSGNVYIAGSSENVATSQVQTTTIIPPSGGVPGGDCEVWVGKLNPGNPPNQQLIYSTVIQGENDEGASDLKVDANGFAYVVGATSSPHFPTTSGVFQPSFGGPSSNTFCQAEELTSVLAPACGDAFVLKLDPNGQSLTFSTFLGGSDVDDASGIAFDSQGHIWLVGRTASADFQLSPQPQGTYYTLSSPSSAGYLAEISSDATQVLFATLLESGSGLSRANVIFMDTADNAWITGISGDFTFPITPGTYPFDTASTPAGFLQKWNTKTNAQPQVQLSATSLTFADEPIGVASPAQSVTLTNVGTGPMQVGVSFTTTLGGFASELQDFAESDDCPASLAASAFCTITTFFQPGPAAQFVGTSRTAEVLIRTNAPGAPHNVALSGNTGQGPTISFQPNPVVFPTQPAGQASPLLPVDAFNGGDMNLTITNIAVTGPNASEFTVILANPPSTHPCDKPVFATGGCEFQVQFTPAANATGTRTATLVFTDSAANSPQNLAVSGTVASGPILNLSPTSFSLDVAAIGTTNPPSNTVTLSNPSATDIQVTALTLGGANVGDFGVLSGTCHGNNPPPFTVAHGGSCFVIVTFTPSQPPGGLRQGTLAITTNPALTLPTVTFSGPALTNTDPSIGNLFLIPNPMDFGTVALGQSTNSGSHIFQFTNKPPIPCSGGAASCGGPLNISAITTGAAQYTLSTTPECTPPLVLQSNGGCQYFVIFTPTAPGGAENGLLSIVSNAPQGTVSFPLTGSGLAITKVQVLPGALQFGPSAIGVTSPALPVVLQDIGNASFSVTSAVASGMFSAQLGDCNQPVSPGRHCTLMVTFTPNAAGNFSGVLTITDNAWGGQQFVTLNGSGAGGPALLLFPPQVDFGTVHVGSTSSPAKTIQLLSTGDTPVTVLGSLQTNGDFLLAGQNCPATLTRGQSCTAQVKFKPTLPFQESGSLLVTSNAQGSPQVAVLTGSGVQPGSTPSTTTLGLSPNPVNQGQAVTLTATVTGQVFPPNGTVTFANNGVPLSSGALDTTGKASFTTSFSGGTHPLSASYLGNATFAASNSAIVNLVVNPLLSLSPMSLFFGTQLLATPSTVRAVTLTNSGGSAVTINSIAIAGGNSSDFGVNHNCPISPSTLAAGNGCTLQATFTPQAAGPRKSSISISDNSGSGVQTIILTGVGTAISSAPSSLNFNNQQVGTPSTSQPVVITNKDGTAVNLWQITFVGANAADFSKSNTSTCGNSLGAGANCTVNVIFTPAAAGSRTASLLISDDGGGSPQAVTLTGTGTSGPAARLSTSAVVFGEQAVGTTSHGETVVLTNAGDRPLAVGSMTVVGATGRDFAQTNTCGSSLAPGASCTIEIRFTPRAMGTRTAVINVLSNHQSGNLQLKVQGTGSAWKRRPILKTD